MKQNTSLFNSSDILLIFLISHYKYLHINYFVSAIKLSSQTYTHYIFKLLWRGWDLNPQYKFAPVCYPTLLLHYRRPPISQPYHLNDKINRVPLGVILRLLPSVYSRIKLTLHNNLITMPIKAQCIKLFI